MKYELNLRDEVVAELSRTSLPIEEVMTYILERDYKKQLHLGVSNDNLSNKTRDGLLRRVYYYQKKAYGDDKTVAEFRDKWLNNKKFNKIFDKYEKKDFVKQYMPIFVRGKGDGKLRVGVNSDRIYLQAL